MTNDTKAAREPLAPCPFCGGPAEFEEIIRESGREAAWSVGCRMQDGDSECIGQQSLLTFARKIEAADAWNRRITRAAPVADVAEGVTITEAQRREIAEAWSVTFGDKALVLSMTDDGAQGGGEFTDRLDRIEAALRAAGIIGGPDD